MRPSFDWLRSKRGDLGVDAKDDAKVGMRGPFLCLKSEGGVRIL
jgi:hypothetical protein